MVGEIYVVTNNILIALGLISWLYDICICIILLYKSYAWSQVSEFIRFISVDS